MEVNLSIEEVLPILLAIVVITGLFQLVFQLGILSRLAFYKPQAQKKEPEPVSIIIAARNEFENLSTLIPILLEQDYDSFEMVVVDDCSWDETPELLKSYAEQLPNFKWTRSPEIDHFHGSKKMAITLGVKAASYERLVFIDADCRPNSKSWLKTVVGNASKNGLVLGYSPYKREKGFLNAVIRFETFHIALQYMGFALAGMPYMGVGRNLSYTKSIFFSVGGFRSHYSIRSGDDDLFVNQVGTKANTDISVEPESWVYSIPKSTWKEYFTQKRRHLTTSGYYRLIHKFLLAAYPVSLLLFYFSSITLLVFHSSLLIVGILLGLRVLIQLTIFIRASKWLGEKKLIPLMLFLEVVGIAINGCLFIANAFRKQTSWKN